MTTDEMLAVWERALAASDRGDREAFLDMADPEVELETIPDWPEADTFRGADSVWGFVMDFLSVFKVGAFETVDPVRIGEDSLVLTLRRITAGDQSGASVELSLGVVVRFRNGRVHLLRYFHTQEEALAAARA